MWPGPRSPRDRASRRRRPRCRGRCGRAGRPAGGSDPAGRARPPPHPANTNRWKRREASVGDGQGRDLRRELVPARLGVDRQARVEPARDDSSGAQLDAELRRDGDPSLVVHRVPVLAGEHPSGGSLDCLGQVRRVVGARRRRSPLPTTLDHFPALWRPKRARQCRKSTSGLLGLGTGIDARPMGCRAPVGIQAIAGTFGPDRALARLHRIAGAAPRSRWSS